MKPRVFISSTYYDLKYIRENLERFIKSFNFTPILFEIGNVTYKHGQKLDESCYDAVKLCQMMILIVGGRYGSLASNKTKTEDIDSYENKYISITRKEYETAKKMNIPIYVFIDSNVYSEYQTYRQNKSQIDELIDTKNGFNFAHVDDIKVFNFIDSLHQKPIKKFEIFDDIEIYLKNQFSGMFYQYLQELQEKSGDDKILDLVSELNISTKRMNEMVSVVGKTVISPDDYNSVTYSQNKLLIDFYLQIVEDNLKISFDYSKPDVDEKILEELTNILYSDYISSTEMKELDTNEHFEEFWIIKARNESDLTDKIMDLEPRIKSISLSLYKINYRYLDDIHKIIKENDQLKDYFISSLQDLLREKVSLPF